MPLPPLRTPAALCPRLRVRASSRLEMLVRERHELLIAEFHKLAIAPAAPLTTDAASPKHPSPDHSGASPPPSPNKCASAPAPAPQTLPIDVLRLIHDHLQAAEAANRAGEPLGEFDACNRLGLFFEQRSRLPLAAYQYRRCLAIAEAEEWLEGRMAAHLALGLGARFAPYVLLSPDFA